jgi:hypothetical protein
MPTQCATRSRCGRSTRNRAGRVAATRPPHDATPPAQPAVPRPTPARRDPVALYTTRRPGRRCHPGPAGAVAPAEPVGAPTTTPRSTTPRGKTPDYPRPAAAPTPRTAATHWAAARHKAATPPHTTQPTTPTAPTPHSMDHHVESPATPATHTPTPPRPTDPTRDENQSPQQAGPPPRSSPPAPIHPAPPTPAPRPPTSSPSHPRVCAATPTATATPNNPGERLRRAAPRAPLTLAGIVLPRPAAVKGEPVRGPLPRTEPSLRDRSAALDNHHPGQRAALYRVRGRTGESDYQSRGDQTGTDVEDVMGPYCDTATSGASCDCSGLSRYAAPDKVKCP